MALQRISCDALIIGSGQAGNPLAGALADAGKKVVLVERHLLGGSCINFGCSPTKALLTSAERMQQIRNAASYGVKGGSPQLDLAGAMDRKDAIIEKTRAGVQHNLTPEHPNIRVLHGHAAFTGAHTVEVMSGGTVQQEITAPLIFINTGTRAAIPEVEGLLTTSYLTPTQLLDLRELPEHLVILGGGYIGVEFGYMFRRFGSRVTVIDSGSHLLGHEDTDVSEAMQHMLEATGIEFVLGAKAHRVSQPEKDGAITVTAQAHTGQRRIKGTHLLVATGRQPNTDDLGLSAAGIKTDDNGYIQVNSRLQTSARGIYALGDVHGGPQFTHISYDDYRVVRNNLLLGQRRSTKNRPLPYVIFTHPQLGRIGLSEQQAREQGIAYRVAKLPVKTIGRARETGQTTGFWKVLVDKNDRILGAAIFCEQGGEIMAMFQLAMAGRLRYQQLQDMVFAHPTWAEGLNNVFRYLKQK
ncbi:mercuric reductase [Hymenobacter sp. BT730]|uniref:mercuric reductase n=1 Tax=Hymenobacter sp. BT730 TaxID=3063332 RepID=UPI0026DEEC73|nr:mercuric reductase [Hymenobacter sp. BT730]